MGVREQEWGRCCNDTKQHILLYLNLSMVGWSHLTDWLVEVFSNTKVTTHVFQIIKYCFLADLIIFGGRGEDIIANKNLLLTCFYFIIMS